MSLLKKLAGQTAIYGISSIVGRTLNFLLVPFYTENLVRAQYGIVTELYAYVAFLNVFYTYGLETAYFRFASKDPDKEGFVYNNALSSIIITSLVLSVLLSLFATPIVEFLDYPGRERYIYWFSVIIAVDTIVAIPFAKLRFENKAKKFAASKLANIFIYISLNLFFIYLCKNIYNGHLFPDLKPFVNQIYNPKLDVDYIFISNLLASLAMAPLLWKEFFIFRFKVNVAYLKGMLVYAYPLLFMGLAGVTNEMLSRAMLKHWLPENFYPNETNLDSLATFGANYKLSIFMALVIQAFRYAAEPFFFSSAKEKNSPQVFSDVMHYFIICCLLLFLVISINLDIIAPVFLRKPEYWKGLDVVPVLLIGYMFLGIYYNLSIWFKLTDKTKYGTWITFSGAAITVALNIMLIPLWGYMGSSVATLVCYVFMAIVCYWLGQKYYPIPYRLKSDVVYIVVTIILVYVVNSIMIESKLLSFVFHLFIVLAYMWAFYLLEGKKLIQKLKIS